MSNGYTRRLAAQPIAILVLCCAIAATVRLYHLGFKSYWLDEAVSIDLARAPWWLFSKAVRTSEANMVLYYSLLRAWVRIGGVDESWVRLLSCVFGVATVPALYAIGLRLFDRVTALLACGILALNTGHVWASQEGRSYALLVMLTTTSWWLLLRAADQRRGIRAVGLWALYVTVAALATYAHFYAVLVLAAQGVTLLFLPLPAGHAAANQPAPRARVSPGIVVACGAAIAAMLWPLALFLTRPHHNIDWISNGARGFDATFSIIDRMIVRPASGWGFDELCILAFAGPLAVIGSWRRPDVVGTRWRWMLLLLWLCVPIVMSVAVSVVVRPVIDGRYLTICLPPLALLAAGALVHLWPRRLARVLLVLLLAIDIISLDWYYRRAQNEDWRDVTTYVLRHARPGDYVLFFASYVRTPFNLYRGMDDTAAAPRITAVSTAPSDRTSPPPTELSKWRPLVQTTAVARAQATRVWVLLSHNATPDCEQAVDDYLRQRFTSGDSTVFNLVRVRLYETPAPVTTTSETQLADIVRFCY